MDITNLRLVLEPMALSKAIDNGGNEWESQILKTHHFLSKIHKSDKSLPQKYNPEWVFWHREFHRSLNAACPSQNLLRITQNLFEKTERYRFFSASHRDNPRHTHDEHSDLMSAVLDRDKTAACEIMRKHLQGTEDNLVNHFSQKNDE